MGFLGKKLTFWFTNTNIPNKIMKGDMNEKYNVNCNVISTYIRCRMCWKQKSSSRASLFSEQVAEIVSNIPDWWTTPEPEKNILW